MCPADWRLRSASCVDSYPRIASVGLVADDLCGDARVGPVDGDAVSLGDRGVFLPLLR